MLEGMILKPNMVLPGLACARQETVDEVADATINSLLRVVPAAVQGSRSCRGAIWRTRLRAAERHESPIQSCGVNTTLGARFFVCSRHPATSFGNMGGKEANRQAAQQALLLRLRCNVAARRGEYGATMETTSV